MLSPCHLVIVGGAAMILHFGAQRATRDVDALLLHGDIEELRRVVKKVGEQHGLPDDWLNDSVKGFAMFYRPTSQVGSFLSNMALSD